MNKIKLFSLAFFSFALSGITKAQFGLINPADLDLFHDRTLVVIVEKPTDMINDKLAKKHHKDKQDAYKTAIDGFNKNFSDAIAQYWKVSGGEVQYKTLDEINDISDKKNYAVIFCRTESQADLNTSYQAKNGILWWPDFKEVAHDKDFTGKMTVMGIALLDRFAKAPLYQFAIPDVFPTKTDLDYAVNAANSYINYKVNHRKDNPKKMDEEMIQENQPMLRDKTLLLRRDWLDKKLTKTEIDKYYPFPYMVAGRDTVDRLIDSADSKYAVAIVTPYDLAAAANGGVQYVQYAYNLEDGSILASSGVPDMPSDPKATASAANATKPLITKKTLLDFCMYIKDSSDDSGKGGANKKKGGKH
ncbi:MAG TPA: hypothetical protein VK808_13115 [Bacteroidia bacterium]|jgi:hypothetical protein|nr:hypothetical protein [Bacteroidia bacterium]